MTTGLWLIRSRRAATKDRHDDQPAIGELIVANDGITIVGGLASAAESFEDRIRSHRAIDNLAGRLELFALLRKDGDARVDDLKDMVATCETIIRRVTQNRRALRTFETRAQTIKVCDDHGARPVSLGCLFDWFRARRARHVRRS